MERQDGNPLGAGLGWWGGRLLEAGLGWWDGNLLEAGLGWWDDDLLEAGLGWSQRAESGGKFTLVAGQAVREQHRVWWKCVLVVCVSCVRTTRLGREQQIGEVEKVIEALRSRRASWRENPHGLPPCCSGRRKTRAPSDHDNPNNGDRRGPSPSDAP